MAIKSPEPVAVIKKRRNKALSKLIKSIPYISFLGVEFDRRGDEITAILPFKNDLVGNPNLPALHGGSIAAFLEISAIIELSWMQIWREIENPELKADYLIDLEILSFPKI
ncbi:MAG: PaaI family thioesterase, partial [Rhodobacterales bacterium]|nr:PaaI family thioesterase [Rhodobacterales bacterium]